MQRYGLVVQPQHQPRHAGAPRHADGNRVAVAPRVARVCLDGVPERVTVVQGLTAHVGTLGRRLPEVGGDDGGLHLHRPRDEFGEPCRRAVGGVGEVLPGEVQDPRVGDEAALDHLGQPCAHVALRQRVQQGEVADDARGLVEGAHEVLSGRQVDPGLAPDGRVDHGEHRGGDADVADAPEPRGSDEAGQVGGGATTDADDHVAAREAGTGQSVPAAGEDVSGLRRLGVRHGDHGHLGVEFVAHLLGEPHEGLWVDDGDPQRVAGQFGQARQGAAFDVDVVRPHCRLDPHSHGWAPLSAANWSATSELPRPSVSTTWVASAS